MVRAHRKFWSFSKDLKNDVKTAGKLRLPWWGALCTIVGGVLVSWFFDRMGRIELVMPIACIVAPVCLTIDLKWGLRRRVWFWATMSVMAGLQIYGVLSVPWPTNHVWAGAWAGVGTLDLFLFLAVVDFLARLLERSKSAQADDARV